MLGPGCVLAAFHSSVRASSREEAELVGLLQAKEVNQTSEAWMGADEVLSALVGNGLQEETSLRQGQER